MNITGYKPGDKGLSNPKPRRGLIFAWQLPKAKTAPFVIPKLVEESINVRELYTISIPMNAFVHCRSLRRVGMTGFQQVFGSNIKHSLPTLSFRVCRGIYQRPGTLYHFDTHERLCPLQIPPPSRDDRLPAGFWFEYQT